MLSRNGEDSREARNGVGPSWNTPGRQLAGASGVWGVLSSGINGDDRDLLPDAFADLSDRCGTEAQMNAALFVAHMAFKAGWHLALGLAGDNCVGVA